MTANAHRAGAAGLLAGLFFLAGAGAWRESATVDEIAHVGAGLSYWQRFDMRLNPEHPPLGKLAAGLPLVLRGTYADYSGTAWNQSLDFFPAYLAQWIFGNAVLGRWNAWRPTLLWARLPMLLLTVLLGWFVYIYACRLGGPWGGLLCLSAYVTTPAILTFGPLVITDLPGTLFTIVALWQLGEVWSVPSSRNALWFGLAAGAALLAKFTGLLLVPIALALFVQTRFWPSAAEPADKLERKLWRKERWRAVGQGMLWALALVYFVYLIFSWNQPDDALNRVGSGRWAFLIRRPLMPLWLYIRGVLLMLLTGSRSTFLLGRAYPHGVPYYFPIVFALKSTLGFLLLLVLDAIAAIMFRKRNGTAIPDRFRPHWRVLMVGFGVFLVVCILSRLDISIRHFMVPIGLLILMLAPLPRILQAFSQRRALYVATGVFAASCWVAILETYPYFFGFVNSLSFGRPVYYLLNDSNVTWNEGLPAVEEFVQRQQLKRIPLDWASLADPAIVVPETQPWDCQSPTQADAGQWVAVTAVSLLENHNCSYLRQYPSQALAGGAFYAFKLPASIPAAGVPGGPPRTTDRKMMWGMPWGFRDWVVKVERHPSELPAELQAFMRRFQEQARANRK
jgi:Dolichyl-phosphate-mannose-protein mannosyltransferase